MCVSYFFNFINKDRMLITSFRYSDFLWKGVKWILCFVDRASLYDLVNKTNLVHNLFLVYLSISTRFGQIWAHHEETTVFMRQLLLVILCGWLSWYAGCTLHTNQSSTQNNKYQVSHKHSCVSWWWAHSCLKHVEIDKYTKNKLCTKLVLFTRVNELHYWSRITDLYPIKGP